MQKLVFIALLWVGLTSSAVRAQPLVVACADITIEKEALECLDTILADEEEKLAQFISHLLKGVEMVPIDDEVRENWKAAFLESHQKWEAYRTSDCALIRLDWWRGSGVEQAVKRCMIHKVRKRRGELRDRYGTKSR